MKGYTKGFTLIEIAIVLVIIGLLLGGVLKGQELITGARVRNLISQQDGVKAAFFGFQDRYRGLPGDYSAASTNINCASPPCTNGNGNGRIEAAGENITSWSHLTGAGFMNGSYIAGTAPLAVNSPVNPYSSYLELVYDGWYGAATTATGSPLKHNVKSGGQVPVEIIAEVDRKIDDGQPHAGAFQFTSSPIGGAAADAGCVTAAFIWNLQTNPSNNCAGASLF